MVVQQGAGDGVDEDAELGALRNVGGKGRIQGVDTLDEQQAALFHMQHLAVVFPQAGDEVVFGNRYFLAAQEFHDVLLHESVVHGIEIIEVVAAVGELGRFHSVHEVVVRAHGDGLETAGLELDGQTLAESGFTGGGRTGDEHHLQRVLAAVAAVDFLGNLHDLLFLEGFRYLDKLIGAAVQQGLVHVPHGAQAHDDVPAQGFVEDFEGAGLVNEGSHLGRVIGRRNLQEKTVVVGGQAPDLEVTGRRNQLPIIIVYGVSQGVVVRVGFPAGFQQLHFVVETRFAELLERAVGLDVVAVEGHILLYQFLHTGFQQFRVFRRGVAAIGLSQVAEIAVGDRVLDVQTAAGEDIGRCFVQQEVEGTAVYTHAAGLPDVNELDVLVLVHLELQAL